LPARGRPPQAAARRAGLEVVEKLLTTKLTSTDPAGRKASMLRRVPPRRIGRAGYRWTARRLGCRRVAQRRLGPSSWASTSTVARALPSSAVQVRVGVNRPEGRAGQDQHPSTSSRPSHWVGAANAARSSLVMVAAKLPRVDGSNRSTRPWAQDGGRHDHGLTPERRRGRGTPQAAHVEDGRGVARS
jgi:hypothetical protein